MKIKKDINLRVILGQPVLIDSSGSFSGIVKLNGTAMAIWQGLEEGLDKDAIAQKMCQEYEVSMDKALADISKFMDELKSEGFLED